MYTFSSKSKKILNEACEELQFIANKAIKYVDFSVICSKRTEEEQQAAYEEGRSRARFGQSPHNWTIIGGNGSLAIDIVPYPCPPWNSNDPDDIVETKRSFERVIEIFKMIADGAEIDITSGASFSLVDMPHIEMADWVKLKSKKV